MCDFLKLNKIINGILLFYSIGGCGLPTAETPIAVSLTPGNSSNNTGSTSSPITARTTTNSSSSSSANNTSSSNTSSASTNNSTQNLITNPLYQSPTYISPQNMTKVTGSFTISLGFPPSTKPVQSVAYSMSYYDPSLGVTQVPLISLGTAYEAPFSITVNANSPSYTGQSWELTAFVSYTDSTGEYVTQNPIVGFNVNPPAPTTCPIAPCSAFLSLPIIQNLL